MIERKEEERQKIDKEMEMAEVVTKIEKETEIDKVIDIDI